MQHEGPITGATERGWSGSGEVGAVMTAAAVARGIEFASMSAVKASSLGSMCSCYISVLHTVSGRRWKNIQLKSTLALQGSRDCIPVKEQRDGSVKGGSRSTV